MKKSFFKTMIIAALGLCCGLALAFGLTAVNKPQEANAAASSTTYTLYCYQPNSYGTNWSEVYIHYWGDGFSTTWGSNPKMTKIPNTDYYYINVPDNITGVIFKNAVGDTDWKTGNLYDMSSTNRVFTSGGTWASFDTISSNFASSTVYYYNSNDWITPYVYYDGGIEPATWPGNTMTSDGDGWWKYTLPYGTSKVNFNNNTEGGWDNAYNTSLVYYNFDGQRQWTLDKAGHVDYYVHGNLRGVNNWDSAVNSDYQMICNRSGSNIAVLLNVFLFAGDELKVYTGSKSNNYGYTGENGSNCTISATGYYNIYLYNDSGYKVSTPAVAGGTDNLLNSSFLYKKSTDNTYLLMTAEFKLSGLAYAVEAGYVETISLGYNDGTSDHDTNIYWQSIRGVDSATIFGGNHISGYDDMIVFEIPYATGTYTFYIKYDGVKVYQTGSRSIS